MNLLRPTITGFNATEHVPFTQFKGAAYSLMQDAGGKIIDLHPADRLVDSYRCIEVRFQQNDYSILCNRHFPVVALSRSAYRGNNFSVCQWPWSTQILTNLGFEVHPWSSLDRIITEADLNCLSEAERKEINYWSPTKIYELIFNGWD